MTNTDYVKYMNTHLNKTIFLGFKESSLKWPNHGFKQPNIFFYMMEPYKTKPIKNTIHKKS